MSAAHHSAQAPRVSWFAASVAFAICTCVAAGASADAPRPEATALRVAAASESLAAADAVGWAIFKNGRSAARSREDALRPTLDLESDPIPLRDWLQRWGLAERAPAR